MSHSHKKTATGITLMQVAVKLYRRTYFLECLRAPLKSNWAGMN